MNALCFYSHGTEKEVVHKNNLNFNKTPKKGSLIVKLHYSSINHLDLWVLKGWKGLNLGLPHIGGADGVGVIAEINDLDKDDLSFHDLKVGSPVACNPGFLKNEKDNTEKDYTDRIDDDFIKLGREELSSRFGILGECRSGTFCEFIEVPISSVRKIKEENLTPNVCGSLLVGLTSYRMLVERAKLIAGETVLIVGAGGGVNSYSIKLAKFLGGKVIALTSSEEKESQAKSLGADHTINYIKDLKWSNTVKEITNGHGAEVIIDNVGNKTINNSLRAASKEGRIITVGNTSGHKLEIDNRIIFTKQLSLIGSTMGSFTTFDKVLELIIEENITSPVHEIIPLEEGRRGYEILEKGSQFGKIVFKH